MSTKTKIKIMQAYEDGKTIESSRISTLEFLHRWKTSAPCWVKAQRCWNENSSPTWNWDDCEYRVKEEPLELWVNSYPNDVHKIHYSEVNAKASLARPLGRTIHMKEVRES